MNAATILAAVADLVTSSQALGAEWSRTSADDGLSPLQFHRGDLVVSFHVGPVGARVEVDTIDQRLCDGAVMLPENPPATPEQLTTSARQLIAALDRLNTPRTIDLATAVADHVGDASPDLEDIPVIRCICGVAGGHAGAAELARCRALAPLAGNIATAKASHPAYGARDFDCCADRQPHPAYAAREHIDVAAAVEAFREHTDAVLPPAAD